MISRWPDGAQWSRNKGGQGVNSTAPPPPRPTMPGWSTARGPCRPGHVALSWPAGVPRAKGPGGGGPRPLAQEICTHVQWARRRGTGGRGGRERCSGQPSQETHPSGGGIKTSASCCARPSEYPLVTVKKKMTMMTIMNVMIMMTNNDNKIHGQQCRLQRRWQQDEHTCRFF